MVSLQCESQRDIILCEFECCVLVRQTTQGELLDTVEIVNNAIFGGCVICITPLAQVTWWYVTTISSHARMTSGVRYRAIFTCSFIHK